MNIHNNTSSKYVINLNREFYYLIFTLWYSGELFFNTSVKTILGIESQTVNNTVSWIIFALLMFQIIFLQHYDLKTAMFIVIITGFIILSVILSDSRFILSTWMFIVAASNVDLEKLIRIARRILLIGMPIVMLLCYMGILEDNIVYRNNMIRHSLGFSHPNQLGLRMFQLVLCIVYIDRKKIGLKDFVIIAATSYFCYRVPNSQTGAISLAILFVLMLGYKAIDLRYSHGSGSYSFAMIVGAVIANTISVLFSITDVTKDRVLKHIDQALSCRFSLGHKVYMLYGISIFGRKIYVTEEERKLVGIGYRMWLDNSYFYMLLRYGIITFLIFSILYIFGMKYFKDNKDNILVIILFLYSIYGIMETGLFMMQHNVFLISLGIVLYDRIGKYKAKDRERYKQIFNPIYR